jgi:DNA-binding transcriptional MocR family regulator
VNFQADGSTIRAHLERAMNTATAFRYEQLAKILVSKIDKGALAPGARMPPVRSVGEQHGVSPSTALQAYRLLQDRGILIARSHAGFFVAPSREASPRRPPAGASPEEPEAYRYEQLASLIESMIENGTLASGMRLPSVRAISEEHGISISTVLQAYRLLEDRGVVVARPQSGFYVAATPGRTLALPSASRPRAKASSVSISGAVATLLEHASNSALVPLGCAVPDTGLLQSSRLDLALARAARQHGILYNTYGAPRGAP